MTLSHIRRPNLDLKLYYPRHNASNQAVESKVGQDGEQ